MPISSNKELNQVYIGDPLPNYPPTYPSFDSRNDYGYRNYETELRKFAFEQAIQALPTLETKPSKLGIDQDTYITKLFNLAEDIYNYLLNHRLPKEDGQYPILKD